MDALLQLIGEFVARVLFYPSGWVLLKLLTLGRWSPRVSWLSEKPEANWVTGLGLAAWVVVLLAALHQFCS